MIKIISLAAILLFLSLGLIGQSLGETIKGIGNCQETATATLNNEIGNLLIEAKPKSELCQLSTTQLKQLESCYRDIQSLYYFPISWAEWLLKRSNPSFTTLKDNHSLQQSICS